MLEPPLLWMHCGEVFVWQASISDVGTSFGSSKTPGKLGCPEFLSTRACCSFLGTSANKDIQMSFPLADLQNNCWGHPESVVAACCRCYNRCPPTSIDVCHLASDGVIWIEFMNNNYVLKIWCVYQNFQFALPKFVDKWAVHKYWLRLRILQRPCYALCPLWKVCRISSFSSLQWGCLASPLSSSQYCHSHGWTFDATTFVDMKGTHTHRDMWCANSKAATPGKVNVPFHRRSSVAFEA